MSSKVIFACIVAALIAVSVVEAGQGRDREGDSVIVDLALDLANELDGTLVAVSNNTNRNSASAKQKQSATAHAKGGKGLDYDKHTDVHIHKG